MDSTGLLGGNLSVTVQPITIDTLTVVKLGIAGCGLLLLWGIIRYATK